MPRISSYSCECGKTFSHATSMYRHKRNDHAFQKRIMVPTSIPYGDGFHSSTNSAADTYNGEREKVLHHPFTMMVVRPTGSGKSTFVKELIENASKRISSPPQRIIWCFGQWQPMYVEIKTHFPNIEFMMGIPESLSDQSFLDVNVRNLLIFDDLMADMTRDKRISELYTKGSHHRNLSVVCLMQNLFHHGRESRTMSLNCHYIVLYKNPRDRQQVAVLANQMYPGKSRKLLDAYEKATQEPFGHLLIDLKQETPEHLRLYDVVADKKQPLGVPSVQYSYSKEDQSQLLNTIQMPCSNVELISRAVKLNQEPFKDINQEKNSTTPIVVESNMNPSMQCTVNPNMKATMNPCMGYTMNRRSNIPAQTNSTPHCPDCGVVMMSPFDVREHNRHCPELRETDENDSTRGDFHTEDLSENATLNRIKKKVINELQDDLNELVEKYRDRGMSTKMAVEKARRKSVFSVRQRFLNHYGELITNILGLRYSEIHRGIMKEVEVLLEKGMSPSRAVKKTLNKYSYLAGELFTDDASTSEESSDEQQSDDEKHTASENDSDHEDDEDNL